MVTDRGLGETAKWPVENGQCAARRQVLGSEQGGDTVRRLWSILGASLSLSACGLINLGQTVMGNGPVGRQGLSELNRLIHATPTPLPTPLVLISRVETVASGLDQPVAIAAKGDRAVVVDSHSGWLVQVSPNGATARLAGPFESPRALAYDSLGDLHVADARAIYRVDDQGTVRLILDGQLLGDVEFHGIWPMPDGSVLVSDSKQKALFQVQPQAGVRRLNVYDAGHQDRFVPLTLENPSHVTGDPEGNLYLLDGSRLLKINRDQKAAVLKQELAGITQLSWHPEGIVLAREHQIALWHGDQELVLAGGEKGLANGRGSEARFFGPLGVAVQPNGQLLVGDSGNGMIRRIVIQ